jgi:type IV secretion system protein TrbD
MLGSREEDPPGYVIDVPQSICTPLLVGGLPRRIGILLGTWSLAGGLYITLYILPLCALLWLALAAWTRHDPDGIPVAKRFWRQKRHYYG